MKYTKIVYQLNNISSKKTFGDILQTTSNFNNKSSSKFNKPVGYDVLESNFLNEFTKLKKYLAKQSKESLENNEPISDKKVLTELIDNYVNNTDSTGNSNNINAKKLSKTQRQMLLAAYNKAGKRKSVKIKDKINETAKIGMILKRNWPLLKFVALESGIDLEKNKKIKDSVSWGFSDELDGALDNFESQENKNVEIINNDSKIEQTETDFNTFLRTLKKVHQTPATHVLPKMTEFESQPTIIHSDLKKDDLDKLENFLSTAKQESDDRAEYLFKAKTNYEWSSNAMSQQPHILERGNFFTPVCIPGTTTSTEEFNMKNIFNRQDKLRQIISEEGKSKVAQFQILKIYSDGGSSGNLANTDNRYWNGDIDNIYKILANLQRPENFRSTFNKYMKLGWTPITSDEKIVVFVRDMNTYWPSLIKNSVIFGTIISGVFASGCFIWLGI